MPVPFDTHDAPGTHSIPSTQPPIGSVPDFVRTLDTAPIAEQPNVQQRRQPTVIGVLLGLWWGLIALGGAAAAMFGDFSDQSTPFLVRLFAFAIAGALGLYSRYLFNGGRNYIFIF